MGRKIGFVALVFVVSIMFSCHRKGTGDIQVAGDTYVPPPVVTSPYKVRVADVFNDTHKVHDEDVIGLLWNGMEDSLKKQGMLWTQNSEVDPYVLEGHVLYFKKGSVAERFVPRLGDTVLEVRVELSRGGAHIATIESKRKISFGRGTTTRKAWEKVFEQVSEDVVNQAVKKF
ncbi:conserved hypothetical protein [Syntrophobacter sp. SbD1]|nr:conserved hypothetical protein [Syntrophobacter sp. SbD1]